MAPSLFSSRLSLCHSGTLGQIILDGNLHNSHLTICHLFTSGCKVHGNVNDGQPITTGCVIPISLPMAGDFDFMCINNDKSLAPIIMPGDVIALKKLATWKTYIPGDFICVVVTSEYKVLRKVSVSQPDEQSINFTQMVDGTPVESSIPKDIIIEIYKVVSNYRRQ